ncbi:MAG: adenosine deaminase family protein [Spirochaetes bacterium]|nr:adenosine deaminase family protein [Spirochaetota bacterium]
MITSEFIKQIPKTDLHVHLDGSLRIPTLIDLAKDQKKKLPSFTVEGLNETVFKEKYANLDEYLKGFALTCSVMQNQDALQQIAYELAYDAFEEGVRYLEVRFAPQLHMNNQLSFEDVMGAVDKGLKKAKKEINSKLKNDEPEFEFGIIVCAMRFCNEHFSEYYKNFFHLHKYTSSHDVIRLLSLELAKAGIQLRNNSDIQIVAFDLAGSEYGFPADNHTESYDFVHKNFMMKTVHAGEAYGPESIFQAITKLHADRIGHGLFLFNTDKVYSSDIMDKKKYVEDLANYIAERRITLEVCLTSNLQTVPEIKDIKNHPFKEMLNHRLSTSFCTDNRLVSHTTVSQEVELAMKSFDITAKALKNIIIYGFKRSFFYHSYTKKREYVRKVINYYENLEKEFGIAD